MADAFRQQVLDAILQKRPDCSAAAYDRYLDDLEISLESFQHMGWTAERVATWMVDTFKGPPRVEPDEDAP
jgi:hypothetical protein